MRFLERVHGTHTSKEVERQDWAEREAGAHVAATEVSASPSGSYGMEMTFRVFQIEEEAGPLYPQVNHTFVISCTLRET